MLTMTSDIMPVSIHVYEFISIFHHLFLVSCPPPLKPRDFVLMRSWLDTGPNGEQMLLSRSVPHKDFPPKKGYVRYLVERIIYK